MDRHAAGSKATSGALEETGGAASRGGQEHEHLGTGQPATFNEAKLKILLGTFGTSKQWSAGLSGASQHSPYVRDGGAKNSSRETPRWLELVKNDIYFRWTLGLGGRAHRALPTSDCERVIEFFLSLKLELLKVSLSLPFSTESLR